MGRLLRNEPPDSIHCLCSAGADPVVPSPVRGLFFQGRQKPFKSAPFLLLLQLSKAVFILAPDKAVNALAARDRHIFTTGGGYG